MFILTALLHVIAFGIAAVDHQYLAARIVLSFAAILVLGLHVAIWAFARFLPLPWTVLSMTVLNAAWAAGGLAWWASRTLADPVPWERAISTATMFFTTGLAASTLLVGWVRFTVRRHLRAASDER